MNGVESLQCDGALLLAGLIADRLDAWHAVSAPFFVGARPGTRIAGERALAALVDELMNSAPLVAAIGANWRCVRAIAFDKSPSGNWSLGWHQDRTIAVARRIDTPEVAAAGLGTWTTKAGQPHVEPPFDLLARMVTLRLHLDDVTASNAPLLVARASHRRGRIAECDIAKVVAECGRLECRADAGDAWLYSTPILHASERSTANARRRVLQFDFSRDTLPCGLEWAGLG
jgi:hypothetical protein